MNSFATSCYRVVLSIKRTDRIRNDRMLDTHNRRNFADLLRERQLRTLGHWLRKEDSSFEKYLIYTTNRGKNRGGRRRPTYV